MSSAVFRILKSMLQGKDIVLKKMTKHQTVKSTMNDRVYDHVNEHTLLLICLPNV